MKGIVDRFEGDFAVIEIDGQTHDVSKSAVDASVKVGDVVTLVEGVWKSNQAERMQREKQIKKLMDDVWAD
ncbi:DUF3006 domain-containing protein [Paenibacillus gallinarum]|uniref:DUF3006 domain-containing protein n=1 Tax=Paenibacillus gallinarum TaxID=2762232 RepID=A0ABR8T3J3_9BACL|nr:DUF3006 domain-containing protein [Paenibacillus gallinarum]MBD7970351.1 DUF3006 domain-containing protein [Paenibacillus gallinarum]